MANYRLISLALTLATAQLVGGLSPEQFENQNLA